MSILVGWSELDAPEGGVGLEELEANIPGFVAAPDDLRFGLAAAFRVNQPDALMEAQIAGDHGHAAGMADVHGDGVGAPLAPFDLEFHARDDALVRAQLSPAILRRCDVGVWGHGDLAVQQDACPGRELQANAVQEPGQ